MPETVTAKLDEFFRPRGIAVVGASAKSGSPNYQILKYANEMSQRGNVYGVNPKLSEIAGIPCYPDLMSIPVPVDLVVMAVGPQNSLAIARDIHQRRKEKGDAGAVTILTAGFKEMGTQEGEELQDELIATIKASGARIIGPNCQGVVDVYNGVNTTFSLPPNTLRGGVTLISQSGAFATSYLRWAKDLKLVGINKFVSLGNMADVDFRELLTYMAHDDRTKVISMYLEGIHDARGMFEIASQVTKIKPIVAIKAGRTEMGTNVALSHTASVAGHNEIYEGAFHQAGVLRARTVAEFYHTTRTLDKMPLPKGNRVCILTVVGGPSTICVDELVSTGEVELARFSEELKKKVTLQLAPSANIGHPDGYIDMTASVTPSMHRDVLSLLMRDDEIDGILFMTSPPGFMEEEALATAMIEGYHSVPLEKRKPLLSVMLAGQAVATCRTMMESAGLPTFEYPDDAARVMINMVRYSAYRIRNR